ncbi:MAG: CBS domain-containing protein, partial [Anaerolineales bacterium]
QIFKGDYGNGLWIAFIGWFLESAASSQVQQQKLHDLLEGYTVQQIMTTDYATIPAETTLQDLVDQHIFKKGKRCYVVTDLRDQAVGILTLHHLQAIPKLDWPQTTAAQVMMPLSQVKWLQPGTPVKSALENMDRGGVNQLPVMQDSQILGMLTREDIISFLRTQVELGLHRNSKNHLGHQQG